MRTMMAVFTLFFSSVSLGSFFCPSEISLEVVFKRFPELSIVRHFFLEDSLAEWDAGKSQYILYKNFNVTEEKRGHLRCFIHYKSGSDRVQFTECALLAGHFPLAQRDRFMGMLGNLILAQRFKRHAKEIGIANPEANLLFEGKLATVQEVRSLKRLLSDFSVVRLRSSDLGPMSLDAMVFKKHPELQPARRLFFGEIVWGNRNHIELVKNFNVRGRRGFLRVELWESSKGELEGGKIYLSAGHLTGLGEGLYGSHADTEALVKVLEAGRPHTNLDTLLLSNEVVVHGGRTMATLLLNFDELLESLGD